MNKRLRNFDFDGWGADRWCSNRPSRNTQKPKPEKTPMRIPHATNICKPGTLMVAFIAGLASWFRVKADYQLGLIIQFMARELHAYDTAEIAANAVNKGVDFFLPKHQSYKRGDILTHNKYKTVEMYFPKYSNRNLGFCVTDTKANSCTYFQYLGDAICFTAKLMAQNHGVGETEALRDFIYPMSEMVQKAAERAKKEAEANK